MRISRPQMFMDIAHVVAKRSTCCRLNVGAVCVHNRRVVSIGYNGVLPGEPHCRGNECPGKDGCHLTTHAEVNAIKYLSDTMTGPIDLYTTDSPCMRCLGVIINDVRIHRLFFQTPYRVTEHMDTSGDLIEIYQVTPAGYIMDWFSRELINLET